MNKTAWQEHELMILKEYYPRRGLGQLSEMLKTRSRNSIQNKACRLKLKKTSDIKKMLAKRAIQHRWGRR